MRIQQSVERLRPLREFSQGPFFQSFGERVEQAPDVSGVEFIVLRFSPLMEDGGNEAIATHPHVGCTNDEIMRRRVVDPLVLVGIESGGLVMPLLQHSANPGFNQMRQITNDVPGVLPGQLDLSAEAEVVANEHTGTGHYTSRECFVVGIPQAQHPAIIVVVVAILDFHEAEIPLTLVAQRMSEVADGETV